MMQSSQNLAETIEDAEKRVQAKFAPVLEPLTKIHAKVVELTKKVLNVYPSPGRDEDDVNDAEKVQHRLICRMLNDLRIISSLASKGYLVQTGTLASALYEIAWVSIYIGADIERAEAWLNHADRTKTFKGTTTGINHIKVAIKEMFNISDEATINSRYEPEKVFYEEMCMLKHGNPIVQNELGHRKFQASDHQILLLKDGPESSDQSRDKCRHILDICLRLFFMAIERFIVFYYPKEKNIDVQPLTEEIQEMLDSTSKT